MKLSYIVAIDNSYELISNFVENLVLTSSNTDEIVLVLDGCDNINTIQYLEEKSKNDNRITLISSPHKIGYGAANNLGVRHSTGDSLIFINSDVFPEKDCISHLTDTLWSSQNIGAVQPLLIYPQTNLVQSTGHLFIDYQSKHVFSMRNPCDPIVQMKHHRQALTTALCIIKREIFEMFEGFNEYYYNSHEGMELTLRINLKGYLCIYCHEAVAYHCTGGARDNIPFDQSRQKTYFYTQWNQFITYDLSNYLKMQITETIKGHIYYVINISTSRIWEQVLNDLEVKASEMLLLEARFLSQVNLYYCLPYCTLKYAGVYLFLCDSISQIKGNHNWISLRANHQDLVMDLQGNLLTLKNLIGVEK